MALSKGRRAGTEIFSPALNFAYKSHNEKTPNKPPSPRVAKVILAVLLSCGPAVPLICTHPGRAHKIASLWEKSVPPHLPWMALTNESALSFLKPTFPFPSRHNTTLKAQRCFSLNILKAPRTVKSAHETLLALFVLHNTAKAVERRVFHPLSLVQPLDGQMDSIFGQRHG